jgi:hypothetical protein
MDCRVKPGNDDVRDRSRDAYASEPCLPPRAKEIRLRVKRREAKRRKAHANHLPRNINKRCRLLMAVRGSALFRSALAFRRFTAALAETPIPTQLQAMFPGTWNQAGVTRPLLSQSSDSTSRLGLNTEGPDARSRSGADCEAARKHRTRSTPRIASGMRPSMSEMKTFVTLPGTII